jgi:hypothetical protein
MASLYQTAAGFAEFAKANVVKPEESPNTGVVDAFAQAAASITQESSG